MLEVKYMTNGSCDEQRLARNEQQAGCVECYLGWVWSKMKPRCRVIVAGL